VISGGADIGAGVGAAGIDARLFRERRSVFLPAFTGTGVFTGTSRQIELQSLKDATAVHDRLFDQWSSSNNIVVAFISELGAKAKPTATGGPAATLTAHVRPGRHRRAAPPFGLREIRKGRSAFWPAATCPFVAGRP
jgi:NitT/TauT family transport system substrate-binding protein